MRLSTDKIIARREDGVGELIFNNPAKRNALSLEMWTGIAEALDAFDTDTNVRTIVLKGAGGTFISGADISQFEERRSSAEKATDYNAITDKAWLALAEAGKPVIAAIEGYCIGGGLAVAMKADIRLAARNAVFGVPAARLGIAYPIDAIRDLVNLVGPSQAKFILLTGQQIDAEKAYRIGLIDELVETGVLDQTVASVTAALKENAPLSMRASKETVDQLARGKIDRDRLAKLAAQCIESADFAEGRRAFMEKRRPRFVGR